MIIKKNDVKKNNGDITIRDLRIGSIVKIHLKNNRRGDCGIVNCEIIALFNSHGSSYFKVGDIDFVVANKGLIWRCCVDDIIEIVKY